jgi:hypothetical protein
MFGGGKVRDLARQMRLNRRLVRASVHRANYERRAELIPTQLLLVADAH